MPVFLCAAATTEKATSRRSAGAFCAHHVDDGTPSPTWDYNVAPTTIQPIIRNNRDTGERDLVSVRWGLIPFFTKDIKDVQGLSTINARAETVATSRTYREPFKKRRCLVPASDFYEWKRLDPKNMIPFAFDLATGQMSLRGLVGSMERPRDRAVAAELHHHHHRRERTDGPGPRPHACHPAFPGTSTAGSSASPTPR